MVRRIGFLFFFSVLGAFLNLQGVPTLEVSLDSLVNFINEPIRGTLTITHLTSEKIDPKSFMLDNKTIEMSLEKETEVSGKILSIYRFEIEQKESGIHLFPSMTVKINGKKFSSKAITYQVKKVEKSRVDFQKKSAETKKQIPSKNIDSIIFKLEILNQNPTQLYIGQRVSLTYRISYNRNIDLTKSEFPLIYNSPFKKIGDVKIKDYQEGQLTIQELTQEIEGSQIGEFNFDPSFIEGYSYQIDLNEKVYDTKILRAETPKFLIQVLPFPSKSQPLSFTNALGRIKGISQLNSQKKVKVGTTLTVELSITGLENLSDFRLPSLQEQPGFDGFFQIDSLPLSKIEDNKKTFQIRLRPLTDQISQIPSIKLSSFDLKSKNYVTYETNPIELKVLPLPFVDINSPLLTIPLENFIVSDFKYPKMPPVLSKSVIPHKMNFQKYWLTPKSVFLILPFVVLMLILQNLLYLGLVYWNKSISESKKLFQEALSMQDNPHLQLRILEEAFWHRLWEKGILKPGEKHAEKLPNERKIEEIREFFYELQSLQFGKNKAFDQTELFEKGKKIFNHII